MKVLRQIICLCLVTGFIQSYAQVEISEYSASNLDQFIDSFGKYEDFIAITNTSTSAVDIGGYGISDKEDKPLKWRFPEGTMINPGQQMVLWCSGRDLFDGQRFHTNFKLTQTKGNEFVILSDPDGQIIESHQYELTLVDHSRVKVDGEWRIATSPTPYDDGLGDLYHAYTNEPSIDQVAGFYEDSVVVTITQNDDNSIMRYSLTGDAPTESDPIYEGPITIESTQVVKARNFPLDNSIHLPGRIAFATFFINEQSTLPIFSIAADRVQDLANGQGEVIPIGSIEYFTAEGELVASSYGSLNRHGQDSWVNPHRSIDWVSRDEMGYSKALDAKIFNYTDRTEYQRFMLRASGDDNYPATGGGVHEGATHIRDEYVHELAHRGGMKLDLRAVERVIAFLNGDYWGVYGLRERPVDHDYTKIFYDQDKYNLHYLLTWGGTWAEYGGDAAFDEWTELRDWALDADMSDPENYKALKDELQVLGLIDYMLTNLNVVSQDWLNYNTGWWKGLNPDGDHKKWGYILWDNDATFDYYINYTGVPNTSPTALPCDMEDIADSMDGFFGGGFGGGGGGGGQILDNIDGCNTIENGSSPYAYDDPIFAQVVNQDNYCCCENWDNVCQSLYDDIIASGNQLPEDYGDCNSIANGTCPYSPDDENFQITIHQFPTCCSDEWGTLCQTIYDEAASGTYDGNCNPESGGGGGGSTNNDVGKHEKIFLKLIDESPEFRQLYYSRQTDFMNRIFSCENMNAVLDSMLNTIRPEMPRQIERWGGSMEEWESNVERLKGFVNERCTLIDDGMLECYEVTGPYDLTIDVKPVGVGRVKLNTMYPPGYPWTGQYFGGMENLVEADATDDDWRFSHWEIESGSAISPNMNSDEAAITLTAAEKVTAVFTDVPSSVNDLNSKVNLNVYPSPASDFITIDYSLTEASDIKIEIYNNVGKKVHSLPTTRKGASRYSELIDLNTLDLDTGMYMVSLTSGAETFSRKVAVIR